MRPTAALLVAAAVAGCSDQSMTRQPHYGSNAPAPPFANGAAAQQPPAGTVAEEDAALRREEATPPPVDLALMQKGRERFGIFCAPCHGYAAMAMAPWCAEDSLTRLPITARRSWRRPRS